MSSIAEYVSFRADGIDEQDLLALRRTAVAAVKAAHPGLQAVPVISRADDGLWTDVWVYESQAAARAANDDAGNIAEFMAFASNLTDVSIATGAVPEHSDSGL